MPSPEPAHSRVAPTGLRLAHYEKPYWSYTVGGDWDHPWTETEPWGRVPSVTGVLGVLDKPALVGWASNITCEAAWRMDTEGRLGTITVPIVAGLRANADELEGKRDPKVGIIKWLRGRADRIETDGYFMPSNWRQFQREMRLAGLDHNSIRDDAALRGSEIHLIGENWVKHGTIPRIADYKPSRQGYARAMAGFLARHGGGLRMAEQIVGSAKHGFAGTCDTVAVATFGDSTVRLDYKTSKQAYARTHFRQVAGAYELGAVECGEDPTDRQGIVILRPDGDFTIHYADEVEWRTTPADSFLRVLDVWRDEQPLKVHEDATYKARRSAERKVA